MYISVWLEAFLAKKCTVLPATEKHLNSVFATWGILNFVSSDRGRYFMRAFIKKPCKPLALSHKLHSSYIHTFLERIEEPMAQ